MKLLAFESSAGPASVCLVQDGKVLVSMSRNDGLTHSQTLLDMAGTILDSAKLTPSDIDLFAVSAGPGSFTGLRIGIATVKGLSWGAQKPCVGVSTLLAMAHCHREWRGLICPAMDARRAQVYTAIFRSDGKGNIERVTEDDAIAANDAAAAISEEEPVLVCGDGAEILFAALSAKEHPDIALAPANTRFQSALGVALAAEGIEPVSAEELTPVYLRKSQAEREREARLAAQNP
ncbi:MAG: tRNA (adenosine(37)-N6)-threonylcarbamoyltransferase complex dimerization subunit type 1 TsaB [Oscillospiraceae bacterium]|nr:tRNA (adenosine(37)-N6)-threonylcarbamoyltransferase complex dimerization subunit type 1 TsaB [Oscillospiraceae bacterium]